MNVKFIKIVAFLMLFAFNSFGQRFDKTINININAQANTEIYPFSANTIMYGAEINGNITFNSDSSLIRIIMKDSINSMEYMMFETYTMIDTVLSFNFNNRSDETNYLDSFAPTSIIIQTTDASVHLSNLNYSNDYIASSDSLQRVAKYNEDQVKINKLNAYLNYNQMLWRADKTDLSVLFYKDKKVLFGGDSINYNTYGYEYYSSGIFGVKQDMDNYVRSTSNFVETFDWRKRHNANDNASQYYDGDPSGSGWVTPIRCQKGCWLGNEWQCINEQDCNDLGGDFRSTGTCVAYGTIAALEAHINLFYNQHLDLDLSEQQMVSPCGNIDVTYGSGVTTALYYIKSNY